MALHWTYEAVGDPNDPLMQGDILKRDEELDGLFRSVHPYFCDPKYIAFMVTTQSCDLIRRQHGQCKADYINLAVVRDLESCLPRFFESVCETVVPGVFIQQSREEAQRLLERIVNQNEQALGLFYLHPDTDTVRVSDSAVVMLRIAVAVRAEHYQLLQRARTARLAGEFRNKLGWLVGNLYSRVGTPDWRDKCGEEKMTELVRGIISTEMCSWVDRCAVRAAKQAGVSIEGLPRADALRAIEEHKPPPFKERIAQAVEEETKRVVSRCLDMIRNKVASVATGTHNDPKNVTDSLMRAVTDELEALPCKLRNRLLNNRLVSKAVSQEDIA